MGDKCLESAVQRPNTGLYNYLSESAEILQATFDFKLRATAITLCCLRERVFEGGIFKDGVMSIPGVTDTITVTKDTWHNISILIYGRTREEPILHWMAVRQLRADLSLGAIDRFKSTITDTAEQRNGLYIDNLLVDLAAVFGKSAVNDPTTATVTAAAIGAGSVSAGGSASAASASATGKLGDEVTLTATAGAGKFLHWIDAATGRILSEDSVYKTVIL